MPSVGASLLAPQQLLKQEPVYGVLMDFGRPVRERRSERARADPGERVREWRRMLEAGEVANRAALARRMGVSRARVTQVLGGRR